MYLLGCYIRHQTMKTLIKLLFVFLLFTVSTGKAQPLFGFTPSEIRAKVPDVEWIYDKWGDNDELLSMAYSTDKVKTYYLFNGDSHSIFTIMYPLRQGTLQATIEIYNKRYVIVDNYNWKLYKEGVVYECTLSQSNSGDYYFMWSIKE